MGKIDLEKSLYLINAMAIVVLGVVFMESIETIFCKQNGRITPLFGNSSLHFILMVNLVVDWTSANVRSYLGDGVSFLTVLGIGLLLLIEGYSCILAFDYSSSIPLLVVIGIVACSVLYDLYFFVKTSSKIYGLFFVGRALLLIMLLISYFAWCFTGNVGGVASLMSAYILAKIVRLLLLSQQEISQ